jgi:hypothetical protein
MIFIFNKLSFLTKTNKMDKKMLAEASAERKPYGHFFIRCEISNIKFLKNEIICFKKKNNLT